MIVNYKFLSAKFDYEVYGTFQFAQIVVQIYITQAMRDAGRYETPRK